MKNLRAKSFSSRKIGCWLKSSSPNNCKSFEWEPDRAQAALSVATRRMPSIQFEPITQVQQLKQTSYGRTQIRLAFSRQANKWYVPSLLTALKEEIHQQNTKFKENQQNPSQRARKNSTPPTISPKVIIFQHLQPLPTKAKRHKLKTRHAVCASDRERTDPPCKERHESRPSWASLGLDKAGTSKRRKHTRRVTLQDGHPDSRLNWTESLHVWGRSASEEAWKQQWLSFFHWVGGSG